MIIVTVSILICFLDLYLKKKVESTNQKDLPRKLFKQQIIIDRSHNYGLMMNFLSGKGKVPVFLSSTAFILVVLYSIPTIFSKKAHILFKTGLSLMTGGAFSNFYDRIKRGYVVDYISFKFKPIKNIYFNIGDFAIFLGGFFILLYSIITEE